MNKEDVGSEKVSFIFQMKLSGLRKINTDYSSFFILIFRLLIKFRDGDCKEIEIIFRSTSASVSIIITFTLIIITIVIIATIIIALKTHYIVYALPCFLSKTHRRQKKHPFAVEPKDKGILKHLHRHATLMVTS